MEGWGDRGSGTILILQLRIWNYNQPPLSHAFVLVHNNEQTQEQPLSMIHLCYKRADKPLFHLRLIMRAVNKVAL